MVNTTNSGLINRYTSLSIVVIVVVTIAVFGQLVNFDFINYDDPYFISLNEHVIRGLRLEDISWAFGSREMGIWHPLTWISYQLEISIFGAKNPAAHHTTNLALHLFNSILVYLLCARLTGERWASLFVALLFSIHPQHVQPVAWISERKEVFAAFFFLISLYLYSVYRVQEAKVWRYLLSLAAVVLALLCKPSVTPLPLILVLIDIYFTNSAGKTHLLTAHPPRSGARMVLKNVFHKLPFFFASAVAAGVAIYLKKTSHWAEIETTWHLGRRLLLMPIGLLHYVKSLFIPWPNQFWIEPPAGVLYLTAGFSSALLILMGFLIWRVGKRVPELVFGTLWFIAMWLPVSGIVLVSNYFVADRYTYLPYIGCFFGLVFLMRSLGSINPVISRSVILVGIALILAFSAMAYRQTAYWRDSVTLFERELELNPHGAEAPVYLGHALLVEKKHNQALDYFVTAIERNPANPMAYSYKGDALRALGHVDEAIDAYRQAIVHDTTRSEPYINLGMLLTQKNELVEAVEVLGRGLEKHPDDLYLLNHAAYTYGFGLDQPQKALTYYRQVLRKEPANTHALHGAGVLYLKLGQIDEAVRVLEKLLVVDPSNDVVRTMLLGVKR